MDDFPFVIGRIQLTQDEVWSIDLPVAFKQRFEDQQLVLWRPGLTIYLSAWNNDGDQSNQERLEIFQDQIDSKAFDKKESSDGSYLRFSYRLDEEAEDVRVPAFYAFIFEPRGHIALSIYFDDEDILPTVENIFQSISDEKPVLENPGILSLNAFVTNAVMEPGENLAILYRDTPDAEDDSGWQFFTGSETQEYVDDAENLSLYPLALVAERYPKIIPHLESKPGTELIYDKLK